MAKLRAAHEIASERVGGERAALLDSLDVARINVERYQKLLEPEYGNPNEKRKAVEALVREMETLSMLESELSEMWVN